MAGDVRQTVTHVDVSPADIRVRRYNIHDNLEVDQFKTLRINEELAMKRLERSFSTRSMNTMATHCKWNRVVESKYFQPVSIYSPLKFKQYSRIQKDVVEVTNERAGADRAGVNQLEDAGGRKTAASVPGIDLAALRNGDVQPQMVVHYFLAPVIFASMLTAFGLGLYRPEIFAVNCLDTRVIGRPFDLVGDFQPNLLKNRGSVVLLRTRCRHSEHEQSTEQEHQ